VKPPHARRVEPEPERLARDLLAGAIGVVLLFVLLFVILPVAS
jgi:uncharacterized RDD family membrane protein YckC